MYEHLIIMSAISTYTHSITVRFYSYPFIPAPHYYCYSSPFRLDRNTVVNCTRKATSK